MFQSLGSRKGSAAPVSLTDVQQRPTLRNAARPLALSHQHLALRRRCLVRSELAVGGHAGDPAPPPDPSIHDGDWRNKGVFPNPTWGWQKAAPKASLYKYGMEHTATPTILNIVQLIHWLPFVPAIILAAQISMNGTVLQKTCGISALQVFCLLLAPLTQVFGSVMGIVMHEYEGWQVAEFRSPTVISDGTVKGQQHTFYKDQEVNITTHNNEWLRLVAYRFLFIFQGGGLVAMNLGSLGFHPWHVAICLLGLASAFILPQEYRMTFDAPWNQQPTYPLSWNVGLPFFVFAAINFYAFCHFFGWWGVLPPLLFMVGGIIEGVVAETMFDQRWHGFAVVLLNAGLIAEFVLFRSKFA